MGNFLSTQFQLCGKVTLFKCACVKNRDTVRSEGEEILNKKYKKDGKQKPKDSIFTYQSADVNIVGMEDMMSQVLHHLYDAKVGVVGIHGMGGAGKTTLAKQLIRRLHPSSSSPSTSAGGGQGSRKFDPTIWAVVSQDLDIRKLQEDIAVELGIDDSPEFENAKDERTCARSLCRHLSGKRFLLVLDDVWKGFDFTRIGIPEFQEDLGNKIVITTREAKVCTDMGARDENIVKVGCLGQEDSWELFQKTIKWEVDKFKARGVYEIARDIASKCGGLPLALITIARAMATKSDMDSWKFVKDELKVSPNEIRGMEDVYNLLQVSYNNLKNEEYKSCLLYSALFPEDYNIEINTMVDYCIGGTDEVLSSDIVHLRREGRFIISELIDACLLERGTDEEYVKVHDAIRDMILFRLGRGTIVSHAGKGLEGTHVVNVREWGAASMLSFSLNRGMRELAMEEEHGKVKALCSGKWVTNVGKIPWKSNNLQVLLLDWNDINNLPRRLFEYCPNLRVLDLSGTKLSVIPASLCSLESLQYLNLSWTKIKTLPKKMRKLRSLCVLDLSFTQLSIIPASLCSLKLLQYLNLSYTPIKTLPEEMRQLCSLIQLDLSSPWEVDKIPNGLFSSLSKLQSLDIFRCRFFTEGENRLQVLQEIVNLRLQDIGLQIDRRGYDVMKFHESDSLSNSITKLGIEEVDLSEHDLFKWMGSRLKRLEILEIKSCENGDVEDLVIDDGHFSELKELHIWNMNYRRIIPKWKLPNLKELRIWSCDEIVELMGPSQSEGDGIIHDQSLLPKLKYISIYSCPNILRISSSPLQLNSLKILQIGNCPSLKDISMIDSPHDLKIWCYSEWWKDLRWENSGGVPPSNFNPIFRRE